MEYYNIDGIELGWFQSYLTHRKQSVLIEQTSSQYREMKIGLPQGTVISPLVFLLFSSDLQYVSKELYSILFADDTAILATNKDVKKLYSQMNKILADAQDWFLANKLSLHPGKTRYIHFFPPKEELIADRKIYIMGKEITRIRQGSKEPYFKYLGVLLDEDLSFKEHMKKVHAKIMASANLIAQHRYSIPKKMRILLYNALVKPHLEYCLEIWGAGAKTNMNRLITAQKIVMRIINLKPAG